MTMCSYDLTYVVSHMFMRDSVGNLEYPHMQYSIINI